MKDALILMFAGIAIVFSVLVVIIFLIMLLSAVIKWINNSGEKKKAKKAEAEKATAKSAETQKPVEKEIAEPITVSQTVDNVDNSDEIIAVISAAVTYMSMYDGKQYKVKSVKPLGSSRPVWAAAGMYENTVRF